jgi:V8-like Glu-specific endopeptidase
MAKSARTRKRRAPPLTEAQLVRRMKARPALKKMPAAPLEFSLPVRSAAGVELVEAGGDSGVRIALRGARIGERFLRPAIRGTVLRRPSARARRTREEPMELSGYLPEHLPFKPVPPRLPRRLRVRPHLTPAEARRRGLKYTTTVFNPENRYTFNDTAFPWCTVGRVDTPGGTGSGVMVGPRHMLTVSHGISWNGDGTAGWVQFRPSYFSGDAPFGETWGIHWYAYQQVTPPTIDGNEGLEDYCLIVLDRRMGDVVGWMGSRTYSEDWDGQAVWRHIGYPNDLAGAEQPSYERDISLDGRDTDAAREIWHAGDVSVGQSGGPFFAWWDNEPWPRVVGVQSWESAARNGASGGQHLVQCIIAGLNDFP